SVWTQLHPTTVPPARENGRMAFDPTRNEIVMFGGYAGAFLSDVWTYNPTTWTARVFDPIGGRRRVAGR
ncbi:MAG TPA: kelch repeat-containing protein, partial [Thermoanaerobaculia bacterium]